jgi:hypothetical protein
MLAACLVGLALTRLLHAAPRGGQAPQPHPWIRWRAGGCPGSRGS